MPKSKSREKKVNILLLAIKTNSTQQRKINRDPRGLSHMATQTRASESQPVCCLSLVPAASAGPAAC